jgi:hypothetical protein
MLVYVVAAVGCVASLGMLSRKMRSRAKPLKNTDAVKIEINLEKTLKSLNVQLPSENFVKNMSNAVAKERTELKSTWNTEKRTFPIIWSSFSESQKKELLINLTNELSMTIEIYSDSDDLLRCLCPMLHYKWLLDLTIVDNETILAVLALITITQEESQLVQLCPPLLVLAADKVDREEDPNRKLKVDIQLTQKVEKFLAVLQQLCVIKFVQQLLKRYKTEPQKPLYIRLLRNVGPMVLLGFIAGVSVYLLDMYGFIELFMFNYKSPFKE